MSYYHATTVDRLESIRGHGLGGVAAERNFPISKRGVYLASDPVLAVGFLLERALSEGFNSVRPREAYDSFIVIVIDNSRINPSKLNPDENINLPGFYRYAGVIDIKNQSILKMDELFPPTPSASGADGEKGG